MSKGKGRKRPGWESREQKATAKEAATAAARLQALRDRQARP